MTAGASPLPDAHDYDARLQHALRTARVGVWRMDLRNGERVWSKEVATLMGLPRDAVLDPGRMIDAIHPDDREQMRSIVQRALADGKPFESDCRVVWPDGSVHWIYVKGCVQLDKDGTPCCIEGIVEDIDEHKRLETQLQQSELTLRTLLSHLPGLVYRCQDNQLWKADFVSEGAEALTGYAHSAFMEEKISYGQDVVHPEERETIWSSIQDALATRRQYRLSYRIRTASGEEKWVWENGTGVYSPEGEFRFLEGVVTDATETKRAEEERSRLESSVRQAQKMEALGALAGGIAHDFNNVLAAISGNASLALADLPPDSPALTSIIEIRRSAARAADLVRQILAFSRQEKTERRILALQPVIAEALKLLRATLPALIELRSDYADNLPNVLADQTQIHQIIMNLGVNAAQAIGARAGLIEFRLDAVTVTDDDVLQSSAQRPGYYVRLRVIDDGCGMDQATLDRVYEPFFTTKPVGQGTGLGLSVVHGIMQAHEGFVTLESLPGKGTTFSLCFPIAPQTAAADRSATGAARHGRGEHILYVDDEDALVFLAERALQRLGYRVTGHVDPSRALEAFRARPEDFDFVVTDLSMPGMSGQDLAHELMKIRPDIPIVLTSGYVRTEDAAAAQRLGIHDVVLKPNSIDDLARVIDAALAARRTHENS